MESKFIVACVSAIRNVFTTMLKTEVTFGKPHIKQVGAPSNGVSGIIGFTGAVRGSIIVCFPLDVASTLMHRFAGAELPPDHPDFADAIGELVNMVAGGTKTQINQPDVAIGCPSVIIGKEHQVFQRKDEAVAVVPCTCSAGVFTVEVALKPQISSLAAPKDTTAKVA